MVSLRSVGGGGRDPGVLHVVHRQVPQTALPFDGPDDVPEERHIPPSICLQLHVNHFIKIAGNCPLNFRSGLM